MSKNIEISAKTIDAAIEKGLEELGVDRESVTVEVLENPKSGFLGIGGQNAKILMTLLSDDGEETLEKKEEKKPVEKKASKKEEVKTEEFKGDYNPAEFLNTVLSYICADAHAENAGSEDGFVKLEIVGENLGGIIGRRGETLDALQHLTNLVANSKSSEKMRVSLDAENYRTKRSEALEKFAQRAAAQAIKYKRNKVLEPMNAYERHVIHATLQDMENISTSSFGVEPNRRVVINYTGPDARRRSYNR